MDHVKIIKNEKTRESSFKENLNFEQKPTLRFYTTDGIIESGPKDNRTMTRNDQNEYTSTGITKKISYDVIELPRKPRRLEKKSIEYIKSKTILLPLKGSSLKLKRKSREIMQSLKMQRSTQIKGPRPIPNEFKNDKI